VGAPVNSFPVLRPDLRCFHCSTVSAPLCCFGRALPLPFARNLTVIAVLAGVRPTFKKMGVVVSKENGNWATRLWTRLPEPANQTQQQQGQHGRRRGGAGAVASEVLDLACDRPKRLKLDSTQH